MFYIVELRSHTRTDFVENVVQDGDMSAEWSQKEATPKALPHRHVLHLCFILQKPARPHRFCIHLIQPKCHHTHEYLSAQRGLLPALLRQSDTLPALLRPCTRSPWRPSLVRCGNQQRRYRTLRRCRIGASHQDRATWDQQVWPDRRRTDGTWLVAQSRAPQSLREHRNPIPKLGNAAKPGTQQPTMIKVCQRHRSTTPSSGRRPRYTQKHRA